MHILFSSRLLQVIKKERKSLPSTPLDSMPDPRSHCSSPPTSFVFSFLHLLLLLWPLPSSAAPYECDRKILTDTATDLRPDQLTVLISGFSETRLPLLRSLALSYASSPTVAAVLILWFNPRTPSSTLSAHLPFSPNSSSSSSLSPISVLRQPSTSLNARFLPRPHIRTRAVAICDDDIEVGPSSLEFAFKVWHSHPRRLVGFFTRSHDLDLDRRSWIYTVHPDHFSMVLTKFMILGTHYLYQYSCSPEYSSLHGVVDRLRNCEDILMNFVVASEVQAGPVLVDARNDDEDDNDKETTAMETAGMKTGRSEGGLSKRAGHREMRGGCIREFHRRLGRMPLRYSYGKVVEEVGEQGLCRKGGKLVPCDEQVGD